MGSPVVFSSRVMSYCDPEEAWRNKGSSRLVLNGLNPRLGTLLSFLQYTLAMGSVANIFTLVIEISARSILTFDCGDYYKPIVWAVVPIFIHFMATTPYLIGSKLSGGLYTSTWPQSDSNNTHSSQDDQERSRGVQQTTAKSTHATVSRRIKRYMIRETTICACRPPVSLSSDRKVPLWCVFFNTTASLIGLIHIIFGTIVLSSVYFIRIEIAVYLLARFIISAIICRLILIMEFAGMRTGSETVPLLSKCSIQPAKP